MSVPTLATGFCEGRTGAAPEQATTDPSIPGSSIVTCVPVVRNGAAVIASAETFERANVYVLIERRQSLRVDRQPHDHVARAVSGDPADRCGTVDLGTPLVLGLIAGGVVVLIVVVVLLVRRRRKSAPSYAPMGWEPPMSTRSTPYSAATAPAPVTSGPAALPPLTPFHAAAPEPAPLPAMRTAVATAELAPLPAMRSSVAPAVGRCHDAGRARLPPRALLLAPPHHSGHRAGSPLRGPLPPALLGRRSLGGQHPLERRELGERHLSSAVARRRREHARVGQSATVWEYGRTSWRAAPNRLADGLVGQHRQLVGQVLDLAVQFDTLVGEDEIVTLAEHAAPLERGKALGPRAVPQARVAWRVGPATSPLAACRSSASTGPSW